MGDFWSFLALLFGTFWGLFFSFFLGFWKVNPRKVPLAILEKKGFWKPREDIYCTIRSVSIGSIRYIMIESFSNFEASEVG